MKPGITVVVANGRYECFGPNTARSARLAAILKKMGGVRDTVPDGTYTFNTKRVGLKLIAQLEPTNE